ncbi:MAG: AraC family transcriptional regulator [Chitinophaga sp.]|uniref:helix-turn-helix domain-containing protein n=1 Tax=Chitinophaga sp. TaxID=1869181 RepID=UPI0025BDB366|nr:AraC family transcriptional regulator [Chitinophaga sp.]MBV8252594.1 AraC family transcriptional regulator [Chitinophaga sp.]
MVSTTEILPALPLRDYIRCYCLREIDTCGQDLIKPIHAIDFATMTFWLSNTPLDYDTVKGPIKLNLKQRHLLGLQTFYQGYQTYNGKYRFLTINFKGNGFFRLFHIPMHYLSDHLLHSDDVIGKQVAFLQEQLEATNNIAAITAVADRFFLAALSGQQKRNTIDNITAAVDIIVNNPSSVNVKNLAGHVNMSLRSFEQHFSEQVGLSPKLYTRLVRFNKALLLKLSAPQREWTDIAHSLGYFDQMHLVKDFKIFSGHSPRNFLQQLPPPPENYVEKIG